jgi:chromosome segregation ATPase
MSEIMLWVSFIRDVGLILGMPILITVGVKLYSQQIEILKARNDLLKETQYDRAIALLESQKKAFLMEREALDKQIAELETLKNEADSNLTKLRMEIGSASAELKSIIIDIIRSNPKLREGTFLADHKSLLEDDN